MDEEKLPSLCNIALVVLVCYIVIFKTKKVMKIMTKWTICKSTLWKCICLEIFSKSNHKCLDLYLKMRENNWEQIWLYIFIFLSLPTCSWIPIIFSNMNSNFSHIFDTRHFCFKNCSGFSLFQEIVLVISKLLQILGLNFKFQKFFSITGTNFFLQKVWTILKYHCFEVFSTWN